MVIEQYPPLAADNPAIEQSCVICCTKFVEGDITAAIPIAPANEEEAKKRDSGRAYVAQAALAHWKCIELFDAVMY